MPQSHHVECDELCATSRTLCKLVQEYLDGTVSRDVLRRALADEDVAVCKAARIEAFAWTPARRSLVAS